MPKVYFLSYARPRDGGDGSLDEVDQFSEDLSTNVAALMASDGASVGFRDSRSIEAGTSSWVSELKSQLMSRPLGIVLLSPHYLERERPWCKWEYDYLSLRNQKVACLHGNLAPEVPRLLLVIDWVLTEKNDLPQDLLKFTQRVGESIAHKGDSDDVSALRFVQERGLWKTMRLAKNGHDEKAMKSYTRFVQCLAEYIAQQWNRWERFRQIAARQRMDLPMPAEFDPNNVWRSGRLTSANGTPTVRQSRSQKRRVYVVYVAANPREVPPERAWRYREDGEYDWRPFGIDEDEDEAVHVGELVRKIEGIDVREWDFNGFCERMGEKMGMAGRRYPVILIVDPWTTTKHDRYLDALNAFVKAKFNQSAFMAPVVIWNDQDAESAKSMADFEERVAEVFGRNQWEPAQSQAQFLEALAGIIAALQRRIRNAWADGRPVDGEGLPRISATS
jgi:hypothetical protein